MLWVKRHISHMSSDLLIHNEEVGPRDSIFLLTSEGFFQAGLGSSNNPSHLLIVSDSIYLLFVACEVD